MTKSEIIEAIEKLELPDISDIRKALDARVEHLTDEFKTLAAAATGKSRKPRANAKHADSN